MTSSRTTSSEPASEAASRYYLSKDILGQHDRLYVSDNTGPLDSSYALFAVRYEADEFDLYLSQTHQLADALLWVSPKEKPAIESLADAMSALRASIDLPVQDIAAMCGLKRRQFYNLLSGESANSSREKLIRTLRRAVQEIDESVGGDTDRVRAALLMPVGTNYESLYDLAAAGDERKVAAAAEGLVAQINTGQVSGMIERPSPALQAFEPDGADSRAREAIGELADQNDTGS